MNGKLNAAERRHIARVKALPCSVCGTQNGSRSGDGSDAHHIVQNQHYTAVALCWECHQGPKMGWHGEKRAWAIAKMDELAALDVTLARAYGALA